MSSAGAARRAAVSVSNPRAEVSRKNGAKWRGPKTAEGKARSAQNALKHGMRAEKHVLLPDEDAAEFAALEAAMVEELAPVGALQAVLARRVAVAAWRLARADRIEADLFAERHIAGGGLGLALIRDGNGTRSFETLLRYRGAAMAKFWRALRTLKALQAEQAAMPMGAPAPRPEIARRLTPNEPDLPEPRTAGRTSLRRRHRSVSHQTNPTAAAIFAQQANRAIGRTQVTSRAGATRTPYTSGPCRGRCPQPAHPRLRAQHGSATMSAPARLAALGQKDPDPRYRAAKRAPARTGASPALTAR